MICDHGCSDWEIYTGARKLFLHSAQWQDIPLSPVVVSLFQYSHRKTPLTVPPTFSSSGIIQNRLTTKGKLHNVFTMQKAAFSKPHTIWRKWLKTVSNRAGCVCQESDYSCHRRWSPLPPTHTHTHEERIFLFTGTVTVFVPMHASVSEIEIRAESQMVPKWHKNRKRISDRELTKQCSSQKEWTEFFHLICIQKSQKEPTAWTIGT